MPDIDPLNTSYFFAAQPGQALDLSKKRKEGVQKPRAGLFASLLEKSQSGDAAQGIDIPAEVARLPYEDAVIRLKDALDLAGDALKELPTTERFLAYKKTVKNFVSYLLNKNYEVQTSEHKRMVKEQGVWVEKNKIFVQVKAIDEKLDRLAQDVLSNHADKLGLLEKIEEINGIVVDLMR
jgi:uncharacterized protein YaaR (DUF327 family)